MDLAFWSPFLLLHPFQPLAIFPSPQKCTQAHSVSNMRPVPAACLAWFAVGTAAAGPWWGFLLFGRAVLSLASAAPPHFCRHPVATGGCHSPLWGHRPEQPGLNEKHKKFGESLSCRNWGMLWWDSPKLRFTSTQQLSLDHFALELLVYQFVWPL